MFQMISRSAVGLALAAMSISLSAPAEARDRYRDRGDDVAIAVGAGLVGLAVGAALADRDDRYYRDRAWYPRRRYVRVRGYPDYFYYYPGHPGRYYRDVHFARDYRPWYRGHYRSRDRYRSDYYEGRHYNHWERGQRRVERWYGRDGGYRGRDY